MHDFIEIQKVHKNRLYFIGIVIIFFVLMISFRLYQVQIIEHEIWKKKGIKTYREPYTKKRGNIYDRNGSKLAISSPVKSCYICPGEVLPNSEGTASVLSKYLGIPKEKIIQAASKKSQFVWLKRGISKETAEAIQKLSLTGVYFKNEFKRIYPSGNIAANLIGGVGQDKNGNLDNCGLEGVELYFDNYLRGISGIVKKQFDAKVMTSIKSWDTESRYFGGISVHLTIDEIIQSILEKEIDRVYKEYKPKSAFILVMNPLTGEILGMANRPNYDNSNISTSKPEDRKNHALLDTYEPGSTFKIITFSAALQEKAILPKETFNCQGSINVFGDKFIIRCHDVHGKQTYLEAIANSCNPVTIQVAMKLGKDKFYEYIKKFGFGKPTNILPRVKEPGGILRPPARWSALSLPSMSMGQELSVNGVQLLSAISTVLNDGLMMKPMIISGFEDINSRTIKKIKPEPVGRMFSPEVAELMKNALRKVIISGTGKKAIIEGYEILGKSGTAQKSSKAAYESGKYFSSFAGFINEPHFKLSVLVVINEPQLEKGMKDLHGGTVAAPAFKNVAEKILMYYNILPEEKKIETFITEADNKKLIKIPEIVGLTPNEIKNTHGDSIKFQFLGKGPIVVKQFPKPFKFLSSDENIIAYLGTNDDLTINKKNDKNFFMPMLIGKSMKETLETLKNYNLPTEISGSGFVFEQKPMPGELLTDNSTIKLNFSLNKN